MKVQKFLGDLTRILGRQDRSWSVPNGQTTQVLFEESRRPYERNHYGRGLG